jgi:glycogen debranching enzyme
MTGVEQLDPLADFIREKDGIRVVSAASADSVYPGNFSRDGFETSILSGRDDLLAGQFALSARYQGTKDDPFTGERWGRVHHELDDVIVRHGLSTRYAASDTTSLFLIAAERLKDLKKYRPLVEQHTENIHRALDEVLGCVSNDNLFWERPTEGAEGFGLYVTYWADSITTDGGDKVEPKYPVVYPLAHFIAARGLLAASRVLESPALASKAGDMFHAGISEFMQPDGYIKYRDVESTLKQVSSDELHALAYIPAEYRPLLPTEAIQARSQCLASPLGYMCTSHEVSIMLSDDYHGAKVWPHIQAWINYGANKHGLHEQATTAYRMAGHELAGQELFGIIPLPNGDHVVTPEGNPKQAWAIAAKLYFTGSVDLTWL